MITSEMVLNDFEKRAIYLLFRQPFYLVFVTNLFSLSLPPPLLSLFICGKSFAIFFRGAIETGAKVRDFVLFCFVSLFLDVIVR